MTEQLRVGLVGAGPWARTVHAPSIADHPGTRLAAVWARRRSAAEELAGAHGAEVADDLDELVSTVDAVAFAVPPDVQAELATEAAAAGRHVLLEKPIAATVDGAVRLAGTVADRGVASLVGLVRRFAPETQRWLEELARLGSWVGGGARWLNGALLDGPYSASPWRRRHGALVDVGPHALDLLDAALGEITEVLAAHRSPEDLWHLVLGHAGGATSTVTLSLRLPLRPPVAELFVYGEHGHRALGGWNTPPRECFTALLDDFVAMVASGTTTHPCDVRRGLHLQHLLHAARRAAGQAD
ncbi:Gfo/Idh/MocA family protein [Gandjariella thermophila]|uniref:Dehydrogenase n=1 Tax=Gandjariella thermophila TaxID=1931992 RepID=A0A4D4J877_9PSEU|nr:Gfo/Idh/MocA family oxidoreductase [Gandjariella thermophila]GDY30716.1 dehydrogenase [Gandjariella thermophila]